ncbi:hypothetical protein L3X38_023534 [Prunus dulcis]|uniref:Uncharacterized protein n=1 Tax=Prunus dulcis TaxID=3755 RepID=A0AAD4VZ71_PRUDU|nr:hypothetical protein L3X38_023534 [Prunus dulcis]
MGDPLGSCSVSSQEQIRAGPVVGARADNIMLGGVGPVRCATLNLGEASWELTGFGFVGTPKLSELKAGAIPGWVTPWEVAPNSEVKRVGGWSNPRMGDHPGKLLRELPETKPCRLVRMQPGPKRTISCYGGAGPGGRNKLEGLNNDDGVWVTEKNGVKQIVCQYFQGLFDVSVLAGEYSLLPQLFPQFGCDDLADLSG